MDLLVIAALSIVINIIIVTMGLSFLSQNLKSLEFNMNYGHQSAGTYYENPLYKLNSKYWHYRPKGSVIVSKKQWADIEKNIGIEITTAKNLGKKLGYKMAMVDVLDKIKEEQAKVTPTSPYAVLNIDSSTPLDDIGLRYQHLMRIYDPRNFVDLDKTFIELAEIRCAHIKKAWSQIKLFRESKTKGKT